MRICDLTDGASVHVVVDEFPAFNHPPKADVNHKAEEIVLRDRTGTIGTY